MEEAESVWAGLLPCAPRLSARRWRGLAGVFLLLLLLRLPTPEWLSVLGLGGCLWWVAQRQAGAQPAALVLLLLAGSPGLLHSGREVWAGAGLFAVVYTALGVAHALQGPRRKWLPRIVLMTGLVAFLAIASPPACALGLVVGMTAAWYLVEKRRLVLVSAAACWGFLAVLLHRFASGKEFVAAPPANLQAGLSAALGCAFFLWVTNRRSRWFGNSMALCASVVLIAAAGWQGAKVLLWGLPFALVFIAGTAADALENGQKRAWAIVFWTLAAFQFMLGFV